MQEKLLKHLEEMRELKSKLLPDFKKEFNHFRYETWYEPDISGGGDYFDVLELPDYENNYGLMIADVSGHGAGAAMETVMIDAILRTHDIVLESGPAGTLNYLNRYMFTKQLRGNYTTAFLMNYNWNHSTITYVSAGHPPAIALMNSGECKLLDDNVHAPLCVDRDTLWDNKTISSAQVSKLVFYTDGITETEMKDGQLLGIDGLIDIIQRESDLESIKKYILDNRSDSEINDSDDITLIVTELANDN